MQPIKIYNNFIPFKGFVAMLTIFILWIRKEYKGNERVLNDGTFNHEAIHMYQQLELALVGAVLGVILSLIFTWWWILLVIAVPLGIYIICWIIEIILPPYKYAYKNICFETEAQYNEWNLDYLKTRKWFAEFKYISNKKYPPLTSSERKTLWNVAQK